MTSRCIMEAVINMPRTPSDNQFLEEVKDFEQENPAIKRAMDTIDMSMKEYEQNLRAIEPLVELTTNSTSSLLKNNG